jgi:hypothetical protein
MLEFICAWTGVIAGKPAPAFVRIPEGELD